MKYLWNQEATFFQLSIVLRLINNSVGENKTENIVHTLWVALHFSYIYAKNNISLFLLYHSKLSNYDKINSILFFFFFFNSIEGWRIVREKTDSIFIWYLICWRMGACLQWPWYTYYRICRPRTSIHIHRHSQEKGDEIHQENMEKYLQIAKQTMREDCGKLVLWLLPIGYPLPTYLDGWLTFQWYSYNHQYNQLIFGSWSHFVQIKDHHEDQGQWFLKVVEGGQILWEMNDALIDSGMEPKFSQMNSSKVCMTAICLQKP